MNNQEETLHCDKHDLTAYPRYPNGARAICPYCEEERLEVVKANLAKLKDSQLNSLQYMLDHKMIDSFSDIKVRQNGDMITISFSFKPLIPVDMVSIPLPEGITAEDVQEIIDEINKKRAEEEKEL